MIKLPNWIVIIRNSQQSEMITCLSLLGFYMVWLNNRVVVSVIYSNTFLHSISCHTLKLTTENSRGLLSSLVQSDCSLLLTLVLAERNFYLRVELYGFEYGTSIQQFTLFFSGTLFTYHSFCTAIFHIVESQDKVIHKRWFNYISTRWCSWNLLGASGSGWNSETDPST